MAYSVEEPTPPAMATPRTTTALSTRELARSLLDGFRTVTRAGASVISRLVVVAVAIAACASASDIPNETAAAESPSTSTASAVRPITGYGDFSHVEYGDIDWYQVVALEIRCLRDQGFAVEVIPPGDGISFSNIPSEQMAAADRMFEACRAGLNLPEYAEPTAEQLEVQYYYLLELRECVEAEGYATSEPPSLETFKESGGLWSPYELVVNVQIEIQEWYALNIACPQTPPGGFATWKPGDPIQPATRSSESP